MVSEIPKDIQVGISNESTYSLTMELCMKKTFGKMGASHIDNGSKALQNENSSKESRPFKRK